MEGLKVFLRRPQHLTSLFQSSSRNFHVVALAQGFNSARNLSLPLSSSSSTVKWSFNYRLVNPSVMNYSTESQSTTEKTSESRTATPNDESTTPDESQPNSSTESESISSAGTTSSSSNSKSQTGEQLPSEVEESTVKYDKLYKSIELEVLAYEPSVLDSYQWFVLTSASHLGIKVGKVYAPVRPDKIRFHLLKSAFVHKKHVVHYEVRTYHRFLTFLKLTSSTADTFLEYIERNLPEGVGLKVTRVEAKPLPDYIRKAPTYKPQEFYQIPRAKEEGGIIYH